MRKDRVLLNICKTCNDVYLINESVYINKIELESLLYYLFNKSKVFVDGYTNICNERALTIEMLDYMEVRFYNILRRSGLDENRANCIMLELSIFSIDIYNSDFSVMSLSELYNVRMTTLGY